MALQVRAQTMLEAPEASPTLVAFGCTGDPRGRTS